MQIKWGIDSEWNLSCPLSFAFLCAAADIELWRPQFFILASTWRKLACLGLIQADIRTTQHHHHHQVHVSAVLLQYIARFNTFSFVLGSYIVLLKNCNQKVVEFFSNCNNIQKSKDIYIEPGS